MPEQFTELVEIQTADELTTIRLDGSTAQILIGENGASGVTSVRNELSEERVRLDTRGVTVNDPSNLAVIQLIGPGRQVLVRNETGETVLRLEGNTALLQVGAEGSAGTVTVLNDTGNEAFRVSGSNAHLSVGTEGTEGDITVVDVQGRGVFHVNGATAGLRIGATDNPGEIRVRDGDDREVFLFNSELALLTLGANGSDGDLQIRDRNGGLTIHLDGNAGDVLLMGADCAESFEVSDRSRLAPGIVVVIDETGGLRESTVPYDRNVAGVLSGAGGYRPGIVLDSHEDESRGPPSPPVPPGS